MKYEFCINVTAFHIKEAVLDRSLGPKDQLLRYNQGDGITLRSDQYAGLKYKVRFKDIFFGDVQLFEKTSPLFQHPDFFYATGRTRDPQLYGPIYQSLLRMVNCDSD